MPTSAGHVTNSEHRIAMIDVDSIQVHYAAYFHWMDVAFGELLRDLGHPLEGIIASGEATPVVDARCEYVAPGRLGDLVAIQTSVDSVGNSSFVVRHEFSVAGSPVAIGRVTHVWIEIQGGGTRVPDWVRDAVGH